MLQQEKKDLPTPSKNAKTPDYNVASILASRRSNGPLMAQNTAFLTFNHQFIVTLAG